MAEHGDESERADAAAPAVPADDEQATKVIEPIDPDGQPTEVIEGGVRPTVAAASTGPADSSGAGDTAPRRRRMSRGARVAIAIVAVVVALVAIVIVVDVVARTIAQQRVAEEIEGNLPAGVEGDVDVAIGGFSVIAQYLSGTMEQVTLTAPQLEVAGAPLDVTIVAEGVPVDLESPVRELEAVINAGEASVNQLVAAAGVDAALVLGEGTVAYDGQIELLGIPITYAVTARPTAAGDTVLLEPVGVEVDAGGGSLDASSIIDRLLGSDPVAICVADRLPQGVEVESIAVAPGNVRVGLAAQGITLDTASLQQTGTCP
ncbi:LmeA family phospholipid-binding protein [Agromyces ramosus]|uniref:DUF2993 family protein n=1 Tax=Agromyces ramosus TaxID=33879 RepID=A0ABU0RBT5_9MICO|nr:DUF2993 domain-containing protein [Agromyces ramosus]MDQ0895516.1 hypothetical protein [Agromyces ramosus]